MTDGEFEIHCRSCGKPLTEPFELCARCRNVLDKALACGCRGCRSRSDSMQREVREFALSAKAKDILAPSPRLVASEGPYR